MSCVSDILRQKDATVRTISPEASVLEAAREMNLRKIGSLVVCEKGGGVVGILTERDILTRIVAEERSPSATRVSEVMTPRVITCTPKTPVEDLRALMRKERIRHVPVVDDGRLCAMISIGDLNTVEVKVMHETIRYFEQYIYGSCAES